MSFDPQATLPFIVCPQSYAALVYDEERLVSTDPITRRAYEIRDGIPVLLLDESTELPMDEWSAVMRRHHRDPQTGALQEPTNGQPE